MAQTRRKRSTKHRGNAAGMIEARGRTGRKPTSAEKRSSSTARGGREQRAPRRNRLDEPPTWRGSINRALIASLFVLVFSVLLLHVKPAGAALLLPFVIGIYVPLGYYTDLFLYRRRQRQKARR